MPAQKQIKGHLSRMLFTGFFTGYSPVAPGTAASVLAAVFFFIEYLVFGKNVWICNLAVVLLMFYPSVKIADAGEKYFKTKDPGQVVIDEMIGCWVSLFFFPFSWTIVISAFILFRLMDILKPFPVKRSERLSGGLGIVIDDVISGIYANLILRFMLLIAGIIGISIPGYGI